MMSFVLTENFIIKFKLDSFSILFVTLFSVLFIAIGIYSLEFFKNDNKKKMFYYFYPLSYIVLIGVATAGNLITMYISFEFMTLLTVPFIIYEKSKEAVKATMKYLYYSIAGAFIALAGVFLLYETVGGNFDFASGFISKEVFGQNKTVILIAAMLLIVGFGVKAVMVPLHSWLPTIHTVAPSPASAMISGVIEKCGIIAVARSVFYIIGVDNIRGTWVQFAWIGLALVTIFIGSMLAYRENIFKKRLAYSTISQMSYIMFGLSLLNVPGFVGGLIHMVMHALVKSLLFLTAGVIIHKTGKKDVREFDGLGKSMPITFVCFIVASITMVGIPPAAAFVSKWYLCIGAMALSYKILSYISIGILMTSALLTAGYLFPVFIRGFLPKEENSNNEYPKLEPGLLILSSLALLTVAILTIGIYPKFIINYIVDIVSGLM